MRNKKMRMQYPEGLVVQYKYTYISLALLFFLSLYLTFPNHNERKKEYKHDIKLSSTIKQSERQSKGRMKVSEEG